MRRRWRPEMVPSQEQSGTVSLVCGPNKKNGAETVMQACHPSNPPASASWVPEPTWPGE